MRKLVNHCSQGDYHMLDKMAYDYVTALEAIRLAEQYKDQLSKVA